MNQQDWIQQWIAGNKETSRGSDLVDSIMTAITARPRKSCFSISGIAPRMPGFRLFRSRPALLTAGTVGGFLRIAVFLYVLLFVS